MICCGAHTLCLLDTLLLKMVDLRIADGCGVHFISGKAGNSDGCSKLDVGYLLVTMWGVNGMA
jgi:hypothetical protein